MQRGAETSDAILEEGEHWISYGEEKFAWGMEKLGLGFRMLINGGVCFGYEKYIL